MNSWYRPSHRNCSCCSCGPADDDFPLLEFSYTSFRQLFLDRPLACCRMHHAINDEASPIRCQFQLVINCSYVFIRIRCHSPLSFWPLPSSPSVHFGCCDELVLFFCHDLSASFFVLGVGSLHRMNKWLKNWKSKCYKKKTETEGIELFSSYHLQFCIIKNENKILKLIIK